MKTQELPSLVGDIGGTNARFALARPGQAGFEAMHTLQCSDYKTLERAVTEYLQQVGEACVGEACLAVASPIHGTRVEMTNNAWCFDTDQVGKYFGWRRFEVVNDFFALAAGIREVPTDQLIKVCGGAGESNRAKLIIGPGTGLGVAALVPAGDQWVALQTQGGHVDFPAADEAEVPVLKILWQRFGRVSAERILSGPGLLNLYQAHGELAGASGLPGALESPAAVLEAALDGSDKVARAALDHFCVILGRVAGNAALTLGALGGVYLCGGIVPRFVDFLLGSGFREAFESKGRMRSLMENTPVFIVTEPATALLGAAKVLHGSGRG